MINDYWWLILQLYWMIDPPLCTPALLKCCESLRTPLTSTYSGNGIDPRSAFIWNLRLECTYSEVFRVSPVKYHKWHIPTRPYRWLICFCSYSKWNSGAGNGCVSTGGPIAWTIPGDGRSLTWQPSWQLGVPTQHLHPIVGVFSGNLKMCFDLLR